MVEAVEENRDVAFQNGNPLLCFFHPDSNLTIKPLSPQKILFFAVAKTNSIIDYRRSHANEIELHQFFFESLILAQGERWRRV